MLVRACSAKKKLEISFSSSEHKGIGEVEKQIQQGKAIPNRSNNADL
jgi:hypothetical protein